MTQENYEALVAYEREIARKAEVKVELLENEVNQRMKTANERYDETERLRKVNIELWNQQRSLRDEMRKYKEIIKQRENRWADLQLHINSWYKPIEKISFN